MSCLIWNCQGLGGPWTVRALEDLIKSYRPTVIFLCDTRLQSVAFEKIKCKLNLFGICVPSVGLSGGLGMLWVKSASVTLIGFSKYHIDVNVQVADSIVPWRFTGFYGEAVASKRKDSWSLLRRLRDVSYREWLVGGDFNEIIHNGEKRGGNLVPEWRLRAFRDTLTWTGLRDLGFDGYPYTWNNHRAASENIQCRLDRVVCNSSWSLLYPNARVSHLFSPVSDHCPLLIQLDRSTETQPRRGPRLYRFENMWARDSGCVETIKNAWAASATFSENIRRCASDLQTWSRSKFGNVRKQIDRMKEEMEKLERSDFTHEVRDRIRTLRCELNELLDREEVMWKQRAKLHWLSEGDKNTRFFHAYASKRSKKNTILGLEDESGSWKESEEDIALIASRYFHSIFQSRRPSSVEIDDVLGVVRCKVDQHMNEELTKTYTPDEVINCMDNADIDLFTTFLWSIWNHRNSVVHGQKSQEAAELILLARNVVSGFAATIQHAPTVPAPSLTSEWRPPPYGYIKINTDAAVKSGSMRIGCGMVARDSEGAFIAWRHCRKRGLWCPEVAEACAIVEAIKMGIQFNWRRLVVESDCLAAVTAFRRPDFCFSDVGVFVDEGRQLCGLLDDVRFAHIRRIGNSVAHNIAGRFSFNCEGVGQPPC